MPEKQVLAIELVSQKHAVNLILQNYMWTSYAALGLTVPSPEYKLPFCYRDIATQKDGLTTWEFLANCCIDTCRMTRCTYRSRISPSVKMWWMDC